MHGTLKRIGIELGRALLAAVLVIALTGTGVVIASSVSGSSTIGTLGAGTSAELAAALSDETGSGGGFVRATSPTLSAPTITGATAFSGATTWTSAAGVPITITPSTNINGLSITATGTGKGAVFSGANGGIQATGLTTAWGVEGISTSGRAVSGQVSTATGIGVYASNAAAGLALMVDKFESHTNASATAGTTQTQAGATALGATYNRVTTGNANDGVALVAGSFGVCQIVSNISANALRVYGANSDNDTINGGAADASVTLSANKETWFCTTDGVAWISGNL